MRNRRLSRRGTRRGFTLIEMIAVIVIIGLIVGLGVPTYMQYVDRAKVTTAKTQTKLFSDALERFSMDQGRFPGESEGLQALINRPADVVSWPLGGYIKMTRIPLDPWNNQYIYVLEATPEGDLVKVISLGRNKQPGGTGLDSDIVNGEVLADEYATTPATGEGMGL